MARKKLPESNEILEKIFDTTHFCIVSLDKDFNFIRVNQAYADTCHHEPEFFPGKNHFDLYPHEENESIFRRVVETGEAFTIYAKPFQFPDMPERGTTYWDWTLHPVKDPSGGVEGLIFVLLDVTERVRSELKLQEKEKRVRALLNANSDCALLVDAQGAILELNNEAARMLGRREEELIGMNLFDLPPGITAKRKKARVAEVILSERQLFSEKEEGGKIIRNGYYPIFDEEGKVMQIAIYSRDVTERRELQNQLLRSERMPATGLRCACCEFSHLRPRMGRRRLVCDNQARVSTKALAVPGDCTRHTDIPYCHHRLAMGCQSQSIRPLPE